MVSRQDARWRRSSAGPSGIERTGPIVVLAIAAALRLVDALRRPLYADEGLSLTIASTPIDQTIQFLQHDFHPPLFFVLLHAVESIHAPIWVIRAVGALIGVVSVGLIMAIVREWSTPRAALIAGAISAVMPSLVFYDSWVRMYGLLQLFELSAFCSISVLARRELARTGATIWWIAWIAANVAALYTHYLAWFALAAQVLFSIATRRRGLIAPAVAGSLVVCLCWLPQFATFREQLAAGGVSFGWFQSHLALGLWQLPSQSTVDPEIEGLAAQIAAALAWLWIGLSFGFAWSRIRDSVLPWLAVPAIITIAASLVLHKEFYDARYFLLLPAAIAGWTGVAADAIADRVRGATPRVIGAVAAVALAIAGIAYAADPSFYTSDWPRVADDIRAHAAPGDVLVFEPGMGNWALAYYLDEHPYAVWSATTAIDIDDVIARLGWRHRIWLIGSGIAGVDPQLRLVHALQSTSQLAFFEEITRAQPSQDVQAGLFVNPNASGPTDGAGDLLRAYAGSYAATLSNKRLTFDVAYADGRLYAASDGELAGACWIAQNDPAGIRIVEGTPSTYSNPRAFSTDVFLLVRLESRGLIVISTDLANGQHVAHYVRESSQPVSARMSERTKNGAPRSCLPEHGRGGRPERSTAPASYRKIAASTVKVDRSSIVSQDRGGRP